jgi:carbonic anhydrase/acetyltransferase-like protein (isoleucine patch superfamily)
MKYAFEDRRVVCRGDYYIAQGAIVIGAVILEHNVSIWFNCVVRGDDDVITLGEGSQIQDGSVLHVDPGAPLSIGRNVSVGHMSMLHGCSVGDGTLIGIKSVVLNNARIGKNCLIGANTLIPESKVIPDGSLVVGSPCKIVRALSPEEVTNIHSYAEYYRAKFKRYKAGLRPDGD